MNISKTNKLYCSKNSTVSIKHHNSDDNFDELIWQLVADLDPTTNGLKPPRQQSQEEEEEEEEEEEDRKPRRL